MRGLSVVIVDDDPGSLRLLQALVEDLGARATTAERATHALRILETQPHDLLITDLRMPEMSGLELLRALADRGLAIPCLLVTGFASDEVASEAFDAGVHDLLMKPINVTEAQARIRHAAEVIALRREVAALRELLAQRPSRPPEAIAVPLPPRVRELSDLPVLPGGAGPLGTGVRDDALSRLDRLGELLRRGVITPAEFEEKKRALLLWI